MKRLTLFRVLIVSAVVSPASPTLLDRSGAIAGKQPAPSVIGTWKGDSTCRENRPACKNEVVVYRFEAVAGKPDVILWFADKIVDGKREPMGQVGNAL